MYTEERPQEIPENLQQTSHKETQETPSEFSQGIIFIDSEETPDEINSETPRCDRTYPNKSDIKMEVKHTPSGEPDFEIAEKRTVLFVDDEEAMLRSIKRCLQDESYNKLFATSVPEALEILQKEEVHVIVTDMLMPSMNGIEFFKIVKNMYPRIVKMILSGYVDKDSVVQAINEGDIVKFIPKIWNNKEDFKKIILEGIDRYNHQNECRTIRQ